MYKNIEDQYLTLLSDVLYEGNRKQTRNGAVFSLFGAQLKHNFKEGFPLLTTKKMQLKSIFTELRWFLDGSTDVTQLWDDDCHIWDGDIYARYYNYASQLSEPDYEVHIEDAEQSIVRPFTKQEFIEIAKNYEDFANQWCDAGKIYGYQWRNFGGQLDQINEIINKLKTEPDDRRMIVSAWNPLELDQMLLPPCHYSWQVYTRELDQAEKQTNAGKERAISLMWNQRSADLPLGIPYNIASYAMLLMIIANEVNMVPDELIGNIGDAHIYANQIEGVQEQLSRVVERPFPTLTIKGNKGLDVIYNDLQLENYIPQSAIYFPLSN